MSSKDPIITSFTIRDLRWPTSLQQIGSDPMNLAGENAYGYLQFHTDSGLVGTGWSFSHGQGNEYASVLMVESVINQHDSEFCVLRCGRLHRVMLGENCRL